MSCGDADNDRELLESAGLAVVMENGLDSMKAIADYITVSIRKMESQRQWRNLY